MVAGGRLAPGIASEALLARFEEFFRPAVIQTLDDSFFATQGGYSLFAAQARYHNQGLLLSQILFAYLAADKVSMRNPEIVRRSKAHYRQLGSGIEGALPHFDDIYAAMKAYYETHPWET